MGDSSLSKAAYRPLQRQLTIYLPYAPGTKVSSESAHTVLAYPPVRPAVCHSSIRRSHSPKEMEAARLKVHSSGSLHLFMTLPCAHTSTLRAKGCRCVRSHCSSPSQPCHLPSVGVWWQSQLHPLGTISMRQLAVTGGRGAQPLWLLSW